jgi:membrane-associated phospholipid phosphatase
VSDVSEVSGLGWGRPVARALADLLGPAPLIAVLLAAVAWRAAPTAPEALGWGGLAVLFATVLPAAFIVQGVRRGRYEGRHLARREQRRGPFLVWLASVALGWALLRAGGAPATLAGAVATVWLSLALSAAANLAWKMSLHAGTAATCASIALRVFGPSALPLWLLVALSAWARVRLGAHTPAQVLAGAVVGATVGLLA